MKETLNKTEKSAAMPTAGALTPATTYKDRIFRMIFKEKREFLDLYNAMNGTHYTNPDELTVTTLDNAIYLGMKNDVSFLLHDTLSLYEHQSTDNPNMPLRNLLYVSDIYSRLTRTADLYGSRLVRIPEPRFVEFYNGTKELPERCERRLSDAYANPTDSPALELTTTVLNINPGKNSSLMKKCRTLRDYMVFVSKVRELRKELPLAQAMEQAVTECIHDGILADFLYKNRAEVMKVGIYEYDEELHIQNERDYAHEQGLAEGRAEGLTTGLKQASLIQKHLDNGHSPEQTALSLNIDLEIVNHYCRMLQDAENDTPCPNILQ